LADDVTLSPPPRAPRVVARPALAGWMFRRNMDLRAGGKFFGVSHETVRRWGLPFDHPNRLTPDAAERERIDLLTAGEVPPDSFDPPSSAGRPS
jgi:hypothetical protein